MNDDYDILYNDHQSSTGHFGDDRHPPLHGYMTGFEGGPSGNRPHPTEENGPRRLECHELDY